MYFPANTYLGRYLSLEIFRYIDTYLRATIRFGLMPFPHVPESSEILVFTVACQAILTLCGQTYQPTNAFSHFSVSDSRISIEELDYSVK